MRFLRWPLLFCLVYGALWMRSHFTSKTLSAEIMEEADHLPLPNIGIADAPTLNTIVEEDPKSRESLSYALAKMSEAYRDPSSSEVDPAQKDFEGALARIQALRNDPELLMDAVRSELRPLDVKHVVERSILLREAYLAFDHDLSPEMATLLEEEREWIGKNVSDISDQAELQGYVQEITRFTTQNAFNSETRKEVFRDFIRQIEESPAALEAFRSAVLQYAEWDLPELIESTSPAAQAILKGSKK